MELFDLHCDTIVTLRKLGEGFYSEKPQFSLANMDKMNRLCQAMAIFIPDKLRGEVAKKYFDVHYDYLKQLADSQSESVEIAITVKDIERITAEKKCALILAVESGAGLAGKEENVDYFASCGVKMMTLTWNGENEIASGHGTDKGFTDFGERVVKRMEEQHIVVDVSHLNDRGFDELCQFAKKPFIATHSNLRSVCSHRRNLTDRQFKEIISRNGLVGLNLYEQFLADDHQGTVDALFRHVYRMLELGGEHVIACGSDFDGADINETLNNPYKFAATAEYFSKQGITDEIIQKIFFDNALDFLKRYEALC